jgi:hypothetical protein
MAHELDYFFSLRAALDTRPVGTVPGGFRLDVEYRDPGDSVEHTPRTGDSADESWQGLKGRLLSGHDWAFVGTDGIAVFDSRFTVKIYPTQLKQREVVLGGRMLARIDLAEAGSAADGAPARGARQETFRRWKAGLGEGVLPVTVSLSFDVSIAKTEELSAGDIDELTRKVALDSGVFVGIGGVTTRAGQYTPLTALDLGVYKVRAA